MARTSWSVTVDCRARDYAVPDNVEVAELRCTGEGQIGVRGSDGERMTLRSGEYDVFRGPSLPQLLRRVVRMETTATLRSGAITLSGWSS